MESNIQQLPEIQAEIKAYLEQPFESVYEKVYSPQVQEVVDHNYNLAMDIIKSDKYL